MVETKIYCLRMENLKMLSGKDKKKSVKRVYNTKNNSITTKGQTLYEASAQFLSSIIDTNQASYHLLLDNKKNVSYNSLKSLLLI